MKKDIILAGVGGQGIISIAATIGLAAIASGLNVKQSEVHGMSQRGGDVSSNLRISDKEIASDLISVGQADLIISVEPMEALRHLPMLGMEGWIVTNTKPFINIANYPPIESVLEELDKLPHHISIGADEIAKELGVMKAANIVVLGAATPFLGIPYEKLQEAVKQIFAKKGEDVIRLNLQALEMGYKFTESHR